MKIRNGTGNVCLITGPDQIVPDIQTGVPRKIVHGVRIFVSGPDAGEQFRRISDEPTVAEIGRASVGKECS